MTEKLKDKVVIVTDSGIGQATAEAFSREGVDVVVQLDQRDPHAVERVFSEAEEKLGTPCILVNNAGVDSTGDQVADLSIQDWDREIKTDLHGPFYCCRQFIRARRRAGGHGKIVNITSVHQEIPRAGAAGYDAAKGGLRNLTRTLCLELAPDHINVDNIAPGMVLTPFNQPAKDDPDLLERQVQNIPWKRAADPAEIAQLAVFLVSEDADYITGQTFTADGGLSMNVGQGA